MHSLLERQLAAATQADGTVDLARLLALVGSAYEESDSDRRRIDRSLTQIVEERDHAHAELRDSQTRRFEAAVSNMSHGLVMFDRDNRLVICNEPYARIYGLPQRLTRPGTPYWDIFDYREQIGTTEDEPPAVLRQRVEKSLADRRAFSKPITLSSGRVILMNYQPMEDGGWLAVHEDITERHLSEETIRFMAQHDSLTGLANRVAFREAMQKAGRQISAGETAAVLCIDLDKFKPINDTQGHLAGDAVLKAVGERIRLRVGDRGIAARLGGDEFAVLIGPAPDRAALVRLAEATIGAVKAPIVAEGLEVRIGASIGIAVAPDDGNDPDALMRASDLALYEAKSSRLGYRFFERGMDERRRRRLSMEIGLRQALERGEFVLHFQPMLAADGLGVVCCEALLRWERPGEGLVPPDAFIPVAEETGQIREVGDWALREACRTAAGWRDDIRVAVNVSPVQFKDNDLVEQVRRALEVSGLSPERLELEITESLFLADDTHNLRILYRLRELGVRIVLDDFGTGYSSLSYLRQFPFSAIKIDRTFIEGITERRDTQAITGAIMQLGKALGMQVTAEGIETEAQLRLVTKQGCSIVQGYLFSPPMQEAAVGSMLGRSAPWRPGGDAALSIAS